MSPKGTVVLEDRCRWCGVDVRLAGERLVHAGTDEGYCADGRHVAERPRPPKEARPARCRLCQAWYPAAEAADHWAVCPGQPLEAKKGAKR